MLKHLACLSAAVALTFAPAPAAADDACIPPSVPAMLTDCSGVGVAGGAAPRAAPSFTPPAPLRAPSSAPRAAPPAPDPKLSAVAIRRGIANVRMVQLLVQQIQGLESLLATTPPKSPDRPLLLKQLGDGYAELEAAGFRQKIQATSPAERDRGEKLEKAARAGAVKSYGQLRAQHPGWCASPAQGAVPASGCVDEVLYDLAYEHEQAGDLDQARKDYLELIQTSPASKYVPNAYLAFGELFFQEAQGDPSKWALAEQSYREVIKFPAPENKVLGYARYKLAYVYWNKGDLALALSELKKTIEHGAQFPTLPNARELAASARKDLVPIYAVAGEPKRAYDLFHPLSGDGPGDNAKTFAMMADLGQNYLDTGHYREAVDLYQDLARRDRGPKDCAYQAKITEAVLAQKTGDKAAAKAKLDRQLQVEQVFVAQGYPDDAKLACANATAALVTETAMIWHLEAVGSHGVRGTMSPEALAFADDLYAKVIRQFSAAEFARFEFPRLVKEDWPTLLEIKAARADLLYAQKAWGKCGDAFDAVVAEDPHGPLAVESAHASALCNQHAYLAAHAGQSDRSVRRLDDRGAARTPGDVAPRAIEPGQKAMLASFDRYLCVAKPDPKDREAYDTYVEIAYARAHTYFEAHRWAEAAAAFRAIALEHPEHDAAIYAAQLSLEALNVMASHGTPSCFDAMEADVARYAGALCADGKAAQNAAACGSFTVVQRDLAWHRLDRRAAEIQRLPGAEQPKAWEELAEGWRDIWQRYGKDACEAKQPGCDRMEQVLFNAARAYSAARLLAKAIAVRKVMLDPRYNLDRTELARKAVYEIGLNYQAIAVYDEAAGWYERFARESPGRDLAPQGLEDAVVLRLGLGQEEQAERDGELFDKAYRATHAALAAQIAFAVGAHDVEREDWATARRRLSSAMGEIDRSAAVDVKIEAHALLGRALWKTGGETGAAAEFAKVRALFRDPEATLAKLREGADEPQVARRVGKVLTAVGEALYFSAEEKRKAVDRIVFPAYKGSGSRDDVLAHVNGKVADWMKRKRAVIEETEREYRKILDLQPSPPPRWVIAAGARVGQMWSKYVAEFRAAPIPRQWLQKGDPWDEIRAVYYEAIDKASEPQRQRAKQAYEACLSYSSKYEYFDEHSRTCEVWLSRNYATQYHAIDELAGAPSRVDARITGQPLGLK